MEIVDEYYDSGPLLGYSRSPIPESPDTPINQLHTTYSNMLPLESIDSPLYSF
jgi:hypothetical protein